MQVVGKGLLIQKCPADTGTSHWVRALLCPQALDFSISLNILLLAPIDFHFQLGKKTLS